MSKWLAAVVLSIPMVAAASDEALSGLYVGGGAADVKLRFDGGSSRNWITGEVLGGYKLSPFVGGEARLGYGSENGADLFYGSVYYRTESANETGKTYLLLGYTLGQISENGDTADLYGFAYGAGVGFVVTSRLNFNLEYRTILDGDYDNGSRRDVKLGGISVNVDYRF